MQINCKVCLFMWVYFKNLTQKSESCRTSNIIRENLDSLFCNFFSYFLSIFMWQFSIKLFIKLALLYSLYQRVGNDNFAFL